MQFLRTLFWVILAVIAVAFSANNWTPVTIHLWSDITLETMLPILMIGSFLIGVIPLLLWHRASKWGLKRKLTRAEEALAREQAGRINADAAANATLTPAPSAAPTAVPPGVA